MVKEVVIEGHIEEAGVIKEAISRANMGVWLRKIRVRNEILSTIYVIPKRLVFSCCTPPAVTEFHCQPSTHLSSYRYLDHSSESWVPDKS